MSTNNDRNKEAGTKRAALASLGISSTRSDRQLWGIMELVKAKPGRQILRRGDHVGWAFIGVEGEVEIESTAGGGPMIAKDDFVIDDWCRDDRYRSTIDVTAATDCTMLVLLSGNLDALHRRLPLLRHRSNETVAQLWTHLSSETVGEIEEPGAVPGLIADLGDALSGPRIDVTTTEALA